MTESITLKSELSSLGVARNFLREALSRENVHEEDIFDIVLAADEWISNIILHSYGPENDGSIEIDLRVKDYECVVTFKDRGESEGPEGKKFDFFATKKPNIEACMRVGKSRGLGIYLIRNVTDKVEYSHSSQGNRLTIIKKIEAKKSEEVYPL